jgi:RNA polymerase sigma factor (sigma-70 family)
MEPTEAHSAPESEDTIEAACELARRIAKSKTRGRNYRDDVIGDALLAVARGVTDRADLENAVRRSVRREWAHETPLVPLTEELEKQIARTRTAPESAHLPLWEAIKTLPPRQYQAVVLTFWGGLAQEEAAREMGITHKAVDFLLDRAVINLRNILRGGYQNAPSRCRM